MRRAFDLDVLACPRRGGRLRLIATLEDPEAIRPILAALGGILTSAPAATARDGHIDVFVRGTDDKVWQKSWTSPWARGYGGQPAWSGSIGWGAWSQPALPFCTAC